MARVVVDANVLIAARLSRDQNHEQARALTTAFDRGDLPTALVASDVLEEVCNYLLGRAGQNVAVETLHAVIESKAFEVVYTPKSDFDAGRSLFRKYDGLSLTDAIVVAFMHRQDFDYLYSFDDDFDAIDDVTRLTTTENPF